MIKVVFYCYAINDWEHRLDRQIKRLVSSGLYDGAEDLYLFVTDPSQSQKDKVLNLIKDLPKIKLDYTEINYGEAVLALRKVDELGKNEDHKILYFHTKGVFNKYKNFETKEIDEIKIKGVESWVEMMEHFLIDNWRLCECKLNDNDIVGVTCHGGWWWGNFWWVNSNHIKKIKEFDKHYNGSRWSTESWLHDACETREFTKTCELYRFTHDPHYSAIPKYFYDKTIDLQNINIFVTEAMYGWFAQQRDEGQGLKCSEIKLIDVTGRVKKLVEKNKLNINLHDVVCDLEDPAFGLDKQIRIKFKTNIDPENEYVISSYNFWKFNIF